MFRGRAIVAIIFAVFLLLAAYALLWRQDNSMKDRLADKKQEPLAVFNHFESYRYKDQKLFGLFVGSEAKIFEPNLVQFRGDLVGTHYNNHGVDSARADFATVEYNAERFVQLMERGDLRYVDAWGGVEVSFDTDLLRTERVRYEAKNQRVFSVTPANIKGPERELNGTGGFEYHVQEQFLELFGKVHGFIKPSQQSE